MCTCIVHHDVDNLSSAHFGLVDATSQMVKVRAHVFLVGRFVQLVAKARQAVSDCSIYGSSWMPRLVDGNSDIVIGHAVGRAPPSPHVDA